MQSNEDILSNPAFGKGHGGAEIGDEAPLGPKLRSKMMQKKGAIREPLHLLLI
jgi:hypothetical protein